MTEEPGVLRLRSDDVAWREFDGEGIVLDLRESTYLAANPVATLLWQHLERGTTEEELVRAVVADFDVDEARAAEDVRAFLADCRERKLLADANDG
jgi:hypothetical protein